MSTKGKQKQRKTFQELSLIDDFLSNAIAANEKLNKPCYKRIISVLLEKEIGEIEIIAQRTIQASVSGRRGIRLDIEVKESKDGEVRNIYDVEPHTVNDLDFPRHNRFYAAKIDGRYVKAGLQDFSKIPDLYILTITNFDIFEKDQMVYTFIHTCKECPEVPYDDGVKMIYFNTIGKIGGSLAIKNMLTYIQDSCVANAVDEATREIHSYVEEAKRDPDLEEGYMTFGDLLDREARNAAINATIKAIKKTVKRAKEHDVSYEKTLEELLEDYPDYADDIPKLLEDGWKEECDS